MPVGGVSCRCPFARYGEHISPHIEHRQQEIAAAGICRRHDDGPIGQIEPSARIERIEIRTHYSPHLRGWERAHMSKSVGRPAIWTSLRVKVAYLFTG